MQEVWERSGLKKSGGYRVPRDAVTSAIGVGLQLAVKLTLVYRLHREYFVRMLIAPHVDNFERLVAQQRDTTAVGQITGDVSAAGGSAASVFASGELTGSVAAGGSAGVGSLAAISGMQITAGSAADVYALGGISDEILPLTAISANVVGRVSEHDRSGFTSEPPPLVFRIGHLVSLSNNAEQSLEQMKQDLADAKTEIMAMVTAAVADLNDSLAEAVEELGDREAEAQATLSDIQNQATLALQRAEAGADRALAEAQADLDSAVLQAMDRAAAEDEAGRQQQAAEGDVEARRRQNEATLTFVKSEAEQHCRNSLVRCLKT